MTCKNTWMDVCNVMQGGYFCLNCRGFLSRSCSKLKMSLALGTTTYTLRRGSLSAVLREDDITVDNLARIFKVCSR